LWRAEFTVDRVGPWEYLVACWIDHLTAWRDAFARRTDPDDLRLAARMGADLIARSAALCHSADCAKLEPWAPILGEEGDGARTWTSASTTSRRWASTCSTCRRSIRSGARSARERTMR